MRIAFVISIFALGLFCAPSTRAQSSGSALGTPGNVWDGNGNQMVTISGHTRVVGAKCVYDGHSKAAKFNYTTVEQDVFDAQPQKGGYLCVNGVYRIKGQDGKEWTGPIHYNVLFKNGKGYKIE